MKRFHKLLQIVCCAIIFTCGLLYFTQEDASAFRCDDRSYAGTLTADEEDCTDDGGQECFVCISDPIEN